MTDWLRDNWVVCLVFGLLGLFSVAAVGSCIDCSKRTCPDGQEPGIVRGYGCACLTVPK